jgi:UPF0716 protein FxsA
MPTLFVLFTVVPLIEIALFIVVGDRLGLGPTIALVVITALLGSVLVSRQGRGQLQRIQSTVAAGGFPTKELAHGAMILVAGALMITPGFLTDAVGFLLLVPQVREAVRRYGSKRMQGRVQIL